MNLYSLHSLINHFEIESQSCEIRYVDVLYIDQLVSNTIAESVFFSSSSFFIWYKFSPHLIIINIRYMANDEIEYPQFGKCLIDQPTI